MTDPKTSGPGAEGKETSLVLTDHLREARVFLALRADGRDDLLRRLAREALALGLVGDQRAFFDKLRGREEEISTGIGRGLAVPHTVIAGAHATFVLAAVLDHPIEYKAIDAVPVDVFFLIGGKPGEVALQLQLLARIARLARQPDFIARLRAQPGPAGFIAAVAETEKALYPSE
jgi:nitrogen PTS system EIIA component